MTALMAKSSSRLTEHDWFSNVVEFHLYLNLFKQLNHLPLLKKVNHQNEYRFCTPHTNTTSEDIVGSLNGRTSERARN